MSFSTHKLYENDTPRNAPYISPPTKYEDYAFHTLAAQILGEIGGAKVVRHLKKIQKETEKTIPVRIFDGHGALIKVEKRPHIAHSAAQKALIKIRQRIEEQSLPQEETISPKGLNLALVEEILETGKIDLKKLKGENSRKLKKFLKFLRDGNASNIVVMGGTIRDLLFDIESNDFDVSVKAHMSEEDIMRSTPTTAETTEYVMEAAKARVKHLSQLLGDEDVDFWKFASDSKISEFAGKDVEYAGPVYIRSEAGPPLMVKRFFVDSKTRNAFDSGTCPSLLKLAIDCDGKIYGDTDSLKDLLRGVVKLSGDGENLTLGNILRLLRIKHQFGLKILDHDYALVRKALKTLKDDGLNILDEIVPVYERLVQKLSDTALDRNAAKMELGDLGLLSLLKDYVKIDFDADLVSGQTREIDLDDGAVEIRLAELALGRVLSALEKSKGERKSLQADVKELKSVPLETPFTHNMQKTEGVASSFIDKLLSVLTTKKVVLLFEDGIGGADSNMILDVLQEIERLKKDPKYKGFLKNLVIKKASSKKISRTINKYLGGDTEVFVFARASTRQDLKNIESMVHSTYIDETKYDWDMYYPIAEIVTIALSQYLDPDTLRTISSLLEDLNIAASDPANGPIVFMLLPDADKYDKQDLIKKYAALKRALIAA